MQQAHELLSEHLPLCRNIVAAAIERVGAKEVASVQESRRATDIAIKFADTRLIVLRCVQKVNADDCSALETMVSEGDFAWAAVICSDQPAVDWPGPIEAFHLSELARLVKRLQALQKAAAS